MYGLSGRVALATGVGPNIGFAIAATLARAGATVLCNDLNADLAGAATKAAAEGHHKAFPLLSTSPIRTRSRRPCASTARSTSW